MPAEPAHKAKLQALAADPTEVERRLQGKRVAGRAIERLVVGDGVKVVLEGGVWILKRPSGTEDIVKDYREERGERLDTARRASEELDGLLGLSA
jgi:phosphomannomutase